MVAEPACDVSLPIDDRCHEFSESIKKDANLNHEVVPGLAKVLEQIPENDFTSEDLSKGLLKVFIDSKEPTFEKATKGLESKEEAKLRQFAEQKTIRYEDIAKGFKIGPTRGTREEFKRLHTKKPTNLKHLTSQDAKAIKAIQTQTQKDSPDESYDPFQAYDIGPKDGKVPVKTYIEAPFQNWGLTVENRPYYTCVPKSVEGVQEVIRFAKRHDLNVRVSGYRHSWSSTFGREKGGILISMLDIEEATSIPNLLSLPLWNLLPLSNFLYSQPQNGLTDLKSITLISPPGKAAKNALVRVGCAVTNEQLRIWCNENNSVTLPLNVIMVEITLGGSNAPICHGAGRNHKTLSDLVRKIEYVDANGELRTIESSEKRFLSAASGCFGLIGVITHLTLEFEPMSYAVMKPLKVSVVEAVPPPLEYVARLPPQLKRKYEDLKPAQLEKARTDFEERANEHYYAEWFWFPFADRVWINTWETVSDGEGAIEYPSQTQIFGQWIEAIVMEGLQNMAEQSGTQDWLPQARTSLISTMAMKSLPSDVTIKTKTPNGLHFRRAIQNTRVRDMEVEIPLLAKSGNQNVPDYNIVQRAWWDAILKVYEHKDTCPMRMPLEMRIMGGSDVTMAPQARNTLGTCSIEILTLQTCKDIWIPFAQEVLDLWMDYKDPDTGKLLNIRPHWAKEWEPFRFRDQSAVNYLKSSAYKDAISEFKGILTEIGVKHEWRLADLKQRFSNDLYDELFLDDVKVPPPNSNPLPLPQPNKIWGSDLLTSVKGFITRFANLIFRRVVGFGTRVLLFIKSMVGNAKSLGTRLFRKKNYQRISS